MTTAAADTVDPVTADPDIDTDTDTVDAVTAPTLTAVHVPTATVLTDPRIDPNRLMLAGIDTETKGPKFTVSEMAGFFFDRSNHWVRWLEGKSEHDSGGKAIPDTKGAPFWFKDPVTGERRKVGQNRNDKSARYYTLTDVEEIAHALAQNGFISGTQLRQTLLLVQVSAEMRGFL